MAYKAPIIREFSHQIPELWCGYGFPLNDINLFIPLGVSNGPVMLHDVCAALAASAENYWPARAMGSHPGLIKPQHQRYVFNVGRWFLNILSSTLRTSSSVLLGGLIKDSISSISSSGIFYLDYYHNYFATCNEISGDSICWSHM